MRIFVTGASATNNTCECPSEQRTRCAVPVTQGWRSGTAVKCRGPWARPLEVGGPGGASLSILLDS
jgi:hypothetical protein